MVNLIMLYVIIGMGVMYYVVESSKEMSDDSFEYFQNVSLLNLFLVGLIWPVTIVSALVLSFSDYKKSKEDGE
jgi:hypothetical protein